LKFFLFILNVLKKVQKTIKIPAKRYFLTYGILYINIKEKMKKKKEISISVNREVLEKIEKLTTNKSRLIEYILLEYLNNNNIKIDDIIL